MALNSKATLLLLVGLTSSLVGCGDKPLQTLETSKQGTYSGSLSPSGQFALVGSIHHGGSLWRIEDAERLYNWNHSADQYSSIVQSTFSTDSKFALTAEKKRFVLWDVASGRPGGFWPAENGVLDPQLSALLLRESLQKLNRSATADD